MSIQPAEILGILHALRSVAVPTWLSGGAAVEFLVVRWTRPHKDLDLVAFTRTAANSSLSLAAEGSRRPTTRMDHAVGGRWSSRRRSGDCVRRARLSPDRGAGHFGDRPAHGGARRYPWSRDTSTHIDTASWTEFGPVRAAAQRVNG